MNAIIITTTSDNREELIVIAQQLLQERLAACCQIVGPHESFYHWQGKLEQSTEWMCLIKTRRESYRAVETIIQQLHSYQVPEIIATEIMEGSDGYLRWLFEATR